MLTKFISVSKNHFQNTETALKNQQALIQGLETQIGQLAKLISERPQGSLLSNTESNPREQLNPIISHDKKWLVEPAPEPRQGIVVSQDKGEVDHNDQKPETISKNTYEPCSSNNKEPIYEEQMLQIEELDEWWTHEPGTHNKQTQDKLITSTNQLKVRDEVLLDAADPQIATSEPNEEIPLTVLSIFPYGTVEVNHPKFDGQAHERALGRVKIGQKFFPNTRCDKLSRHSTWPWVKLLKQHGRETHLCLETMVETENLTRALDTPVPSPVVDTVKITRACACIHGSGRSERRLTRPCNMAMYTNAPNFENHKTHGLK
ncbi:hypothetical protein GOBAR_AA30893 [Gossypium barbadense]|uniref:Uncharacterized protein n=1 Tax=Gossypium barbadense TaxID=3634 RepID=A0A2P5WFC0_GOSBA|nr:hypothetical protein GOBAR_AA30893 [Gossypium barbadense]